MNITIDFILILAFVICEIAAALSLDARKINLMALGLVFFGVSLLV